MNGRWLQCSRVAIATVAALGLCQLCFNNSASSFVAPPSGSRGSSVVVTQGEAKSLPLWLVLASTQPAAAATDANSHESPFACVAALAVALAFAVSFKHSFTDREPLNAATMLAAQR